MAMSGIPWWTTDIGGYFYGNITDPEFRELVARWFQYAAFCGIFRLHGHRVPEDPPDSTCGDSGGSNEVWSYGDEVYNITTSMMAIRETLRPYVMSIMKEASVNGTPVMRPLWFEFPGDPCSWNVEDQYMFGSTYLVCPVYVYQAVSRNVYFPGNATLWQDYFTGDTYTGGQTRTIETPLKRFPLYVRLK